MLEFNYDCNWLAKNGQWVRVMDKFMATKCLCLDWQALSCLHSLVVVAAIFNNNNAVVAVVIAVATTVDVHSSLRYRYCCVAPQLPFCCLYKS